MGARRLLVAGATLMVATSNAAAQAPMTPPPAQPPPPAQTPPPPVTSPESKVFGKVLSVDDAVAIALETQPNIKARISDYIAAAFRVDQALAPLLPQITGFWTAARDQNVSGGTAPLTTGTQPVRTIYSWTTSTFARVSLSQILFDFGKNFASTEAARKLADVALEDTELQRQLVTQTVKESFTNINFAVRLIQVNQQAVERAELNLRSARGFFEVGTRPKSDVARARPAAGDLRQQRCQRLVHAERRRDVVADARPDVGLRLERDRHRVLDREDLAEDLRLRARHRRGR